MLYIVLLELLCVHRNNNSLVSHCVGDLTYMILVLDVVRTVERIGPRDASETVSEKVSSQRHGGETVSPDRTPWYATASYASRPLGGRAEWAPGEQTSGKQVGTRRSRCRPHMSHDGR